MPRAALVALMASPLSNDVPARPDAKEEEDEVSAVDVALSGQALRDQCYRDVRSEVQRLKNLMKSQRAAAAAGPARAAATAPPPPPPPLPWQQQPPPPPPPPARAAQPAHRAWTKRPAAGPPPGLAGVRRPPQKQHQPPPLPEGATRHAPQPAPNAHRAPTPPGMPPANAGKPPLHPRSSARLLAKRLTATEARKKPSVVCGVCDVRCMSASHLRQHEQGRKHRNKLAYAAGEMNVQCPTCNVHLSSELNIMQHYSGKHHLRRLFLPGAPGATGNQAA